MMLLPKTNTYTAGPWTVSDNSLWARSPWNARVRIATITQFSPANGIDSAANARLMGAAPEMLIELISTTAMLQSACLIMTDAEGRRMALDQVRDSRAVLARALGANPTPSEDEPIPRGGS